MYRERVAEGATPEAHLLRKNGAIDMLAGSEARHAPDAPGPTNGERRSAPHTLERGLYQRSPAGVFPTLSQAELGVPHQKEKVRGLEEEGPGTKRRCGGGPRAQHRSTGRASSGGG